MSESKGLLFGKAQGAQIFYLSWWPWSLLWLTQGQDDLSEKRSKMKLQYKCEQVKFSKQACVMGEFRQENFEEFVWVREDRTIKHQKVVLEPHSQFLIFFYRCVLFPDGNFEPG